MSSINQFVARLANLVDEEFPVYRKRLVGDAAAVGAAASRLMSACATRLRVRTFEPGLSAEEYNAETKHLQSLYYAAEEVARLCLDPRPSNRLLELKLKEAEERLAAFRAVAS